jgi:diguanylate cyclase (GGDEF)-like protein/PAS domain S-box-containing protein
LNEPTGFDAFFNALASPFLQLDVDFVVVQANDAYIRTTRFGREELVGRNFFDLITQDADHPDSDNVLLMRRSLEKALATGEPDTLTFLRFSLRRSGSTLPEYDERYWNTVNTPLVDRDGKVYGLLHNPVDVTETYTLRKMLGAARREAEHLAAREEDVIALDRERYLLKQVIEKTPSFTAFMRGPQHVFELVNAAFRTLTGNRPVLGRTHAEAFPELAKEGATAILNKVFQTGTAYVGKSERILLKPDATAQATELFVDYVYQPIVDGDGTVSGILLQGHDITSQKRTEHALRTVNNRWESALEGAGDGVWDWNIQTDDLFFSRRWKEMLGYAEDEIASRYDEWHGRVHPDDVGKAVAALGECIDGRSSCYVNEHRVRHRDGHWLTMLARARVFERDASGRPLRMIGTFSDLSETRKLTEELRQSHELLKDLSEQVPGVLFQYRLYPDGRSAFPFASRGLVDTHEVMPEAVLHDSSPIFKTIVPEDVEGVRQSFEHSARTLDSWNHEFRMKLPRQGLCWRQGIAKPKKLADGSIVWHGFITDITSRKVAEAENVRLALVAQKITTAVTITDSEGVIEWVNPAFTAMTGYALEEAVGKGPGQLLSGPHTAASTRAIMREAIVRAIGFDVDVLNYHKSGRTFWQRVKADPVFDETGRLQYYIAVQTDISEKKKSDDVIWKQANYDALTGLPNRRLFRDRLDMEMRKAYRSGHPMALLFIDLDHFKEANDLLGHDGGDVLLRQAAERISGSVRDSDTVARLGGDEFTVILSALEDAEAVDTIAKKILDTMREPFVVQGETFILSASIGVTMYPADALQSSDLLKHADQAMYAAKNSGRNQFSHFTFAMQRQAEERYHLSMDLREALSRNQLSVFFQPVVCLTSGRIVKAEALVRWRHPVHGLIEPTRFIPVAEENGTIHEIGEWVFRQAAEWSRRWSLNRDKAFQISVNKSPVQFLSQSHSASWPTILKEMGLPLDSISVEITEGVLLNASTLVTDELLHYRDEGIQVALDDFGTGYSSMLYLRKFDIDYLKIDQSFIQDMANDAGSRAIAETIILMAHKLGMKVIAEGIETEDQKTLLMAAGCDFGQGFLFSQALPPGDFERLWLTQ